MCVHACYKHMLIAVQIFKIFILLLLEVEALCQLRQVAVEEFQSKVDHLVKLNDDDQVMCSPVC